ncbi:hypothetical protein SBV1_960071 [Verrucomicrobia bacterium]|nr:hypothetical protein SBV1_960071 [Verrucomicrobiota bacterium]
MGWGFAGGAAGAFGSLTGWFCSFGVITGLSLCIVAKMSGFDREYLALLFCFTFVGR